MSLIIHPLQPPHARQIVTWEYEPPYDIYSLNTADPADQRAALAYLLDRGNQFHAIIRLPNELVGFCSFGADARVPGGDYDAAALDIGLGMRPDLTGQGHGASFVTAVLDFARGAFSPDQFRVTIAAFNQRAQRVWQQHGFRPVHRFQAANGKRPFIIFVRNVDP